MSNFAHEVGRVALRLKRTWFGMSRLSWGSRTQFLHILLTRSSLKMRISWLQYWTLKKDKALWWLFKGLAASESLVIYLHGFVVNTENGTLCLNSSVMWLASGGLGRTDSSTTVPNKSIRCRGADLPRQNGARTEVFRAGNEEEATAVDLRKTCWK